jgi:hypothetical protein
VKHDSTTPIEQSGSLLWFAFYSGDHFRATRGWPAAARTCRVELLAMQWDRGSLPVELDALRMFVEPITDAEWRAAAPLIDHDFPIVGDVRLNPAFAKYRERQHHARTSRRESARRAAAQRWKKR